MKVAHVFEQQADFTLATYKGSITQAPLSTHAIKLSYKDAANNSYLNESTYTVANFHNVQWPAGLTGYLLETSPNLTANSWTAVPGVLGNSHTLIPGAKSFFRLRKQ